MLRLRRILFPVSAVFNDAQLPQFYHFEYFYYFRHLNNFKDKERVLSGFDIQHHVLLVFMNDLNSISVLQDHRKAHF